MSGWGEISGIAVRNKAGQRGDHSGNRNRKSGDYPGGNRLCFLLLHEGKQKGNGARRWRGDGKQKERPARGILLKRTYAWNLRLGDPIRRLHGMGENSRYIDKLIVLHLCIG